MTTRAEIITAREALYSVVAHLPRAGIMPDLLPVIRRDIDLLALTAEAGLVPDPSKPWEVFQQNGLLGYRRFGSPKVHWLTQRAGHTVEHAQRIVDVLNEDATRRANERHAQANDAMVAEIRRPGT